MKPINLIYSILSLLLLCGCAETRIYENGQLVFAIQGNATNVDFTSCRGTHFHADSINHSIATQAWGTAAAQTVGALGTAAGVAAATIIK